jgi:hypothetical protein
MLFLYFILKNWIQEQELLSSRSDHVRERSGPAILLKIQGARVAY